MSAEELDIAKLQISQSIDDVIQILAIISSASDNNSVVQTYYEIEVIKRRLGWRHAKLISKVKVIVTTLGFKGALIETKDRSIKISPSKPENESDPTGAGDAFRAGFLAGYIRDLELEVCGKMGALAAVYTVEKYGTQTHKFTLKEFRQRYRKNYKEDLPDLKRVDW